MRTIQALLVLFAFVALSCAFKMPKLDSFAPRSEDLHRTRSIESSSCTSSRTLVCVTTGQTCYNNTDLTHSYTCLGGYCNYTSLKCPVVASLGQACSDDIECTGALSCHPVTSVCVGPNYVVDAGAACTQNDQCVIKVNSSGYALGACTNGVCSGTALGGSCQYSHNCAGYTFCLNGVCSKPLANGAACNDDSNDVDGGCVAGSECYNGVCTRQYSLSAGSNCNYNQQCGPNLFCSGNYFTAGTCMAPGAAGVACDYGDLSCPTGASCGCATGYSNTTCVYYGVNSPTETSVLLSIYDCINAVGCTSLQCVMKSCSSQYCAYRSYVIQKFYSGTDCSSNYERANIEQIIPNTCTSAGSVSKTVNSLLAVVSLVLIFVFTM